jgi:NADPH:quinone reductase-like Zn-dependent oxidoreductase
VPCRSPASAVPEVLEIVDVPEPEAGPNQQVYDVSTAGVNYADTPHWLS